MNVLGLIPARGGSKGIPRKNVAMLGGRPLIAWTIAAAKEASVIDRIVVSTDDEGIAEVARRSGAEVPFIRPVELAGDTAPAEAVIKHAVEELDAQNWRADVVVYLQPTSPFRSASAIARAVELIGGNACDTVVSVVRVPHAMTPGSLMRLDGEFLAFAAPEEERSFRRQDKPVLYARNGPAVLAMTRETALRGILYGSRIKAVEMGALESHDIDEPIDLEIAEALLPLVQAGRTPKR